MVGKRLVPGNGLADEQQRTVESEDMRSMTGVTMAAAVLAGLALATADAAAQDRTARGAAGDIVDVAVAAGSFTTLAKALQTAGLVETLKGAGPYTVFAPTDDAFAKLPAGTLEALLKDKEQLKAVLTYHVVAGRVASSDVVKLTSAKTVNGASVKVAVVDGKVKVDDAMVVNADVMASNGVIHVIDRVILPSR